MAIYRHTSELPPEARGGVVAIGNFEGLHLGHQAVLSEARRIARELGTACAVLTFEPHPRRFFRPNDPPFQLTSFRLKARLLESMGVDNVFFLTFNRALSRLGAADFVRDVLVRDLRAAHVLVGDNFAFGHKREGRVEDLRALGRKFGFGVTVLARIHGPDGKAYSSTAIRDCLRAGDPKQAAYLLGRYWELEGRVVHGARLGRKLGFPTANIALGEMLEPAHGVYAVRAGIDRSERTLWHDGVANLGIRPMMDDQTLLLEVHLFDTAQDLYGQHMRVALVDYLRPEGVFEDMDAMVEQMKKDARRARAILDAVRHGAGPVPGHAP